MDYFEIIKFAKENPTLFIALITSTITILGQFLSLIEYFRLKGIWDFYYLDDIGRKNMRSGFHPEYLVTSFFIIAVICLVVSIKSLKMYLMDNLLFIIAIIITCMAIYIGSYIIFYFFSRYDVEKGIYSTKEYYRVTAEKALYTTIKYFFQILLISMMARIVLKSNNITTLLLLIIINGGLLVFFEYNISKIRTAHFVRTYEMLEYNNQEYCILCTISNTQYYLVKVEKEDDLLKLFLDTKYIVNIENNHSYKLNFKKIIRLYNNHEIKSHKYYIG